MAMHVIRVNEHVEITVTLGGVYAEVGSTRLIEMYILGMQLQARLVYSLSCSQTMHAYPLDLVEI